MKTMFSLFLVTLILVTYITVESSSVIAGSTTISISVNTTSMIGNYTLPWPFNDYILILKVRMKTNPVLHIKYSSDKDLISPREDMTLRVDVSPTIADLNSWIIIQLQKGAEKVLYKEIEVRKFTIEVPGSYKSPTIIVPAIPLHEVGVPLTIGFSLRIEAISTVPLSIKAEGLVPDYFRKIIKEDQLSLAASFTKGYGLGAKLTVEKAGLNIEGKLFIGLTIVELPLIKYEFPPLSLGILSRESFISKELFKLKTPVSVSISASKEKIVRGERLILLGKVSPQVRGIKINILARKLGGNWFTVATSITTYDGSYKVDWVPKDSGEYEIKSYHPGSEYSTEAWSEAINIRVLKPAEFRIRNLVISPSEITPGSTITIGVDIENIGEATGTYRLTLKINNQVEAVKNVTLTGGASEHVVFKLTKATVGTYNVEIDGQKGTFMVKSQMEIILPYIIIVGITVIILIIAAVLIKRRMGSKG